MDLEGHYGWSGDTVSARLSTWVVVTAASVYSKVRGGVLLEKD
jgi:hypothetical protein